MCVNKGSLCLFAQSSEEALFRKKIDKFMRVLSPVYVQGIYATGRRGGAGGIVGGGENGRDGGVVREITGGIEPIVHVRAAGGLVGTVAGAERIGHVREDPMVFAARIVDGEESGSTVASVKVRTAPQK
jgi:hypothetical protein